MSITVPQLFLVSHAIHVNHERAERRYKRTKGTEVEVEEDVPTYMGKPLSDCNSEEMKRYYGGFFSGA